jgi:hypothetical protein
MAKELREKRRETLTMPQHPQHVEYSLKCIGVSRNRNNASTFSVVLGCSLIVEIGEMLDETHAVVMNAGPVKGLPEISRVLDDLGGVRRPCRYREGTKQTRQLSHD